MRREGAEPEEGGPGAGGGAGSGDAGGWSASWVHLMLEFVSFPEDPSAGSVFSHSPMVRNCMRYRWARYSG